MARKYEAKKYLTIFFLLFSLAFFAQTAQKPSANFTTEKTGTKTEMSYLSVIEARKDFNKLTRVYNRGTVNEMPHLLFAIDRNKNNKVYYINTPKYEFHLYFINEQLGFNFLPEDIESNYKETSRRFIFGTMAYQNLIQAYTYEFWEGDKITSDLLLCTQNAIAGSFYAPVIFKTNSTLHEEVAQKSNIRYVTQDQLVKEYAYIALNEGKTKGRVRIAGSIDDLKEIEENDILVLSEVPISIPIVAGIITERASTLLSHINIFARGLKIPSIYLRNASEKMKQYEGKYIELKASVNGYKIKEIEEPKSVKAKKVKYALKSDLKMNNLVTLDKMRAADNIYCGVKAANLGEINAKIKNVMVPDGFSIPYAQYYAFMVDNGMYKRIDSMQKLPDFQEQVETRRIELAKLRDEIESAEVDSSIVQTWIRQWQTQLHGKGVFVRSSSNSEDLKNFSGAGLFTTVPNVKSAAGLENAVKKVWASVYNFEAYESRRRAGVPDSLVMMSVFIQLAVDSEISGVMITKDPYNPVRWDVFYIAAKRGIGIKVVEGKRIAEQVMYSERSKAVQLISRSEENVQLRLDPDEGGVKELPVKEQRRVMSDRLVGRLAFYGRKIKSLFDNDMDIEWAVVGDRVIILQARPYK